LAGWVLCQGGDGGQSNSQCHFYYGALLHVISFGYVSARPIARKIDAESTAAWAETTALDFMSAPFRWRLCSVRLLRFITQDETPST